MGNVKVFLALFLFYFGLFPKNPPITILMEKQASTITGKNTFSYLALGDSYTIGESVDANERFPVQLVKKLNNKGISTKNAKIIAKTGWTTAELSDGIKNENVKGEYDLVTLLIGVNNQYRGLSPQEYRFQFKELLKTATQLAEKKAERVIVISIPDYGITPFAETRNPVKIGNEIDSFNRINKEESQLAGVNYVDITAISRTAKTKNELIANDGLHPSGEMYRLWVEEIFPVAKEILEK